MLLPRPTPNLFRTSTAPLTNLIKNTGFEPDIARHLAKRVFGSVLLPS